MAEAALFETGTLIDVWTPVGKDAGGAVRYRRANFDILKWQSSSSSPIETYVVPLGTERISGAEVNLKGDGSMQIGQEFGYYSGESLVLEPHQADGSDSIVGLHGFGPI